MKFALVDNTRREAAPGLTGVCQFDGHLMIPRCGEIKRHHWAHAANHHCDPWWENETDWHRGWKNLFPEPWQEIRHTAPDGEVHIADVKTPHGWVFELQYSAIRPDERRSRDAFYQKLIWVVDGTRLKRDAPQFVDAWNHAHTVNGNRTLRILPVGQSSLLRKWGEETNAPIIFDLGHPEVVWW